MQGSERNCDGRQDKKEQNTGGVIIIRVCERRIECGYMSYLGLEFRSCSNPEEWLREGYDRVEEKPLDGKEQEPEGIVRGIFLALIFNEFADGGSGDGGQLMIDGGKLSTA